MIVNLAISIASIAMVVQIMNVTNAILAVLFGRNLVLNLVLF